MSQPARPFNRDNTLRRLARTPLVAVAKHAAKLSPDEQLTVSRGMESDAERLVLLGAYLSALSHGQDHNGARKIANRTVVKVRRAMGFTYPDRGLNEVQW